MNLKKITLFSLLIAFSYSSSIKSDTKQLMLACLMGVTGLTLALVAYALPTESENEDPKEKSLEQPIVSTQQSLKTTNNNNNEGPTNFSNPSVPVVNPSVPVNEETKTSSMPVKSDQQGETKNHQPTPEIFSLKKASITIASLAGLGILGKIMFDQYTAYRQNKDVAKEFKAKIKRIKNYLNNEVREEISQKITEVKNKSKTFGNYLLQYLPLV